MEGKERREGEAGMDKGSVAMEPGYAETKSGWSVFLVSAYLFQVQG